MASTLSTHVLDAVRGAPAAGVRVRLDGSPSDEEWVTSTAVTDGDGRVGSFGKQLQRGTYRLVFDTAAYFAEQGTATFYPEVVVSFVVDADRHYHVPLLLSPYAYSTYRGS